MPFTPTVRIKNGVAWRPDATPGITELPEIMPLPQARPRRKGDPPPPADDPSDQSPEADAGAPNPGKDGNAGDEPLPPPQAPEPHPQYPKVSVQDQLAMALAAQMMPDDPAVGSLPSHDPSMRHLPELYPKTVPDAGNLRKRLLLPQVDGISAADAFRTWMQQSRAPDSSFPSGDDALDPQPTRRDL
jgi:hypothetical protein